ncbi:hypothetical protein, partial [Escherichia coli]|uniref:hypothetical protein n=1 Tax=Escherichia coli TaxID=562 RepID=UPI0013B38B00
PEVFKELEMQVPGGHGDPQAYHEEVAVAECGEEVEAVPAEVLPGDAGDDFINDVTVQPVQKSDDELARLRKLAGI